MRPVCWAMTSVLDCGDSAELYVVWLEFSLREGLVWVEVSDFGYSLWKQP